MARKLKNLRFEFKYSYHLRTEDKYALESIANCSYELGANPANRRGFIALLKLVQARSVLLAPEENVSYLHRGPDYVRGLANLALHHEHYLRPPGEWLGGGGNKNSLFASLARHLLTKYSPPGWLNSVWLERLDPRVLMDQELYRHAGAGGRIRDLNPPIPLTRRMEHFLLQAPDEYDFHKALRYAEARGLDCERNVAHAFASSNLIGNFDNVEFWRSVMRLFAANPAELPGHQVRPVVDFLNHIKFETNARGRIAREYHRPGFTLKGRTAASLLRMIQEWHAALNANAARRAATMNEARRAEETRRDARTWRKSPIAEFRRETTAGTTGQWLITEITQGGRLAREGRVMNHCVASYQSQCHAGTTSIWSMRFVDEFEEKPALTIEVDPRTRRIRQARGKFNRLPNQAEWPVLREWALNEGLVLEKNI